MTRILIFDSDEEAAAELKSAVETHGEHEVLVAPTLREACLVVTQFPHELAFVPRSEAENASQALLSLQPDLAVVAVAFGKEPEQLQPETEGAYAVLTMDEIRENLADLLGEEATTEVTETAMAEEESPPETTAVGVESSAPSPLHGLRGLNEALEEAAQRAKILALLLTEDSEVLEQGGSLDEEEARLIASRISETWRPKNSALIQFLRLPSRTSDLLLFTKPLHNEYLVTLVGLPDVGLGQAREIMDELFRRASVERRATTAGDLREPVVTAHVVRPYALDKESYALLWQPRKRLPTTLQDAIRKALEPIAEANSCALTYARVEGEVIHIVVSCPSGRNMAWVANIFKRGVEEEIQEQFGIPARLWKKGYYAAHSKAPLSQAELNLFMDVRARA